MKLSYSRLKSYKSLMQGCKFVFNSRSNVKAQRGERESTKAEYH